LGRCIRRLTGHEPGSAHHDLEDLGNDRLQLRALDTSPALDRHQLYVV
jgi:hypothetical protein